MEDDKSLTSMVITVIVALIVTGAVLVPIVGGLAGSGGSGGGDGGDSAGDYEVLNTLQSYSSDGTSIEIGDYKSYQTYDSNLTPTMKQGYSLNLEGLNEIYAETPITDSSSGNYNYEIAYIDFAEYPTVTYNGVAKPSYEDRGYVGIEITRIYGWEDSGSDRFYLIDAVTVDSTVEYYPDQNTGDQLNVLGAVGSVESHIADTYPALTAFELTIGTDYSVTMSMATAQDTITINGTASFVEYISENDAGWIPAPGFSLSNILPSELKVDVGSTLYLVSDGHIDYEQGGTSDTYEYTSQVLAIKSITSADLATAGKIELTMERQIPEKNWTFTEKWTLNITDSVLDTQSPPVIELVTAPEGVTVTSYDINGDVSAVSSVNANPYEDSSSGGGSGGSSDSGSDLGTVGTIIGVIPIFVVLAILIYAVQYLRTRPEQY